MVIFLWKISQGIVSGYVVTFTSGGGRRARSIAPTTILKTAPSMVRNAREHSLGVKGARLCNLLPETIRSVNTDHVGYFKNNLDIFLPLYQISLL